MTDATVNDVTLTATVKDINKTATVADATFTSNINDAELSADLNNTTLTATVAPTVSVILSGDEWMNILHTIDQTAYDLNGTSFSVTSNIATDFILDNIEFNFSTTQERTITITSKDGTLLFNETNSVLSLILYDMAIAFDANDNFTVAVTQTAGACIMDCIAKIRVSS